MIITSMGTSMKVAPGAPASDRASLAGSLGSGGVLHGVSAQAVDASQRAFVYALQNGLRLGSAVALVGALLAWTLVAPRAAGAPAPSPDQGEPPEPAEQAAQVHAAETIHV